VGLGMALANQGKSVLLIDMDEGLRCLDLMLGIDSTTVFDLADILSGKDIEDAIYNCEETLGLSLIPAPAKPDSVDPEAFSDFALKVKDMFDVVIFDFPAGINLTLYDALPEGTQFFTVAVPDPVSIRDAAAIGNQLKTLSLSARLIINRFVYKQCLKYKHKNIDSMIDGVSIRLIGIIPESEELTLLSLKHKLKRRGKAIKAFTRIADRIQGAKVLLPALKKI
jgi:septum site-determining protein MinD